jgi:phosphatidylglycerophosphate synthase
MPATKRFADLFTLLRALLAPCLVALGLTRREAGLPLAIWMMILSWTSDSLDGPLARRSRPQLRTWLGEHDLQVDMLASMGLLVYMVAAGFVPAFGALMYLGFWLVIYWRLGLEPALGMLMQAPIYAWFLYVALTLAPAAGTWMLGWIVAALVITWPRFPNVIVPGFLQGMGRALRQAEKEDG